MNSGISIHQIGKGIVGKKKGLSKGPKVRKGTRHVPSHKWFCTTGCDLSESREEPGELAGDIRPRSTLLHAQSVNFILKAEGSHILPWRASLLMAWKKQGCRIAREVSKPKSHSLCITIVQDSENEGRASASDTGPGT